MSFIGKLKVGLAQRLLDVLDVEMDVNEEDEKVVNENLGVPKKTLIDIQNEWISAGLIR